MSVRELIPDNKEGGEDGGGTKVESISAWPYLSQWHGAQVSVFLLWSFGLPDCPLCQKGNSEIWEMQTRMQMESREMCTRWVELESLHGL